MIYWPVRTPSGSDNLCNTNISTIPVSAGKTPRSAVYEGLTITSPTVAMSLSSIEAGCGTTIDSTIILVPPEQVTSIIGVRAEFGDFPFEFANLNWRCQAPGSTNYTIEDSGGDDCYQEVPALAYMDGPINFDVDDIAMGGPCFESNTTQIVIANDYTPAVVLPSVFYPVITSLWGPYCQPWINGVWDPPVALTPVASAAGPSTPSPPPVSSTSSPASPASAVASPTPSSTTPSLPTLTTSIQEPSSANPPSATQSGPSPAISTNPSASAQGDAIPSNPSQSQASGGANPSASAPGGAPTPSATRSQTNSPTSPQSGGEQATPTQGPGDPQASNSGAAASHGPTQPASGAAVPGPSTASPLDPEQPAVSVSVISIGTHLLTQTSPTSGVLVLQNSATSVTLSQGGSALVVGTETISLNPSGQVVGGVGSSLTTITPLPADPAVASVNNILTVGTTPFAVAKGSDGVYSVQYGSTTLLALPGDPGIALGHSQYISAVSNGIVVQSGESRSTMTFASATQAPPKTMVVNSDPYTMSMIGIGTYELKDATTSLSLVVGGSAVTLGSQVVSAGAEGIVLQSGASLTTMTLAPTGISLSSAFTIGSQTYTAIAGSNGVFEVADATTTFLLSQGVSVSGTEISSPSTTAASTSAPSSITAAAVPHTTSPAGGASTTTSDAVDYALSSAMLLATLLALCVVLM